ncbi:MAG: hypothetical protein FWE45_01630 [Firmicutes bacterium]|nr:hypothetical protein [Bacillota bacterium]
MTISEKLYTHANLITSPFYLKNDGRHDLRHRDTVTTRGQAFVNIATEEVSKRSVFIGTMYHDIAHHINPKKHEEISAQICEDDKGLRRFFSHDEIIQICQGIEDHRASLDGDPRNTIGKIISSADRRVCMTDFLESTYTYRLTNSPEFDLQKIIDDSYLYTLKKFGNDGYANDKMYFPDLEYSAFLQQIKAMTTDKDLFISNYLQMVNNYHKNQVSTTSINDLCLNIN